MKQLIIIFLLVAQVSIAQQKDSLDIFKCFEAVEANHPRAGEKPIIDEQTRLKINNLRSQWYPSLEMNAQASYQSDVVEIDVNLPFDADFPSPSKDQYRVTMDVNQRIYDGGVVKYSENMERMGKKVEKQSVKADLYQIKDQVMEVYFGIMLFQKQKEVLQATMKELKTKIKSVKSAVDNGTLLPSDLKNLQAERLNMEQKLDDLNSRIQTSYGVLNKLTGMETDTSTELVLPEITLKKEGSYHRPENELFKMQKNQLDTQEKLIQAQKMPKVFAFGQLGYGKPGLNMLNDEFDPFYIVGAKLSWNIWDWNRTKRKRQLARLQKNKIDVKENAFNQKVDIQLEKIEADISKLKKTLQRDKEIIGLRQEVIRSSRSKLENGVITSADYITDLNRLTKAKITHERHNIELLKAKLNHLFTIGKI
ncbi:MAG: TolC family protein [Bacteroidales bacterium]|nr:TolC family protein [Bacteroidales bacterium]